MKVYYVNPNFLSKSSIYELQVLMRQIDDCDKKKVNKHMSGLFCASLSAYIPNVIFSRISVTLFQIITKGCKNDRTSVLPCLLYTSVEKIIKKKRTETSKGEKKHLKKSEDVGFNED